MATRSTIGIQNSDGTVEAVYCHWDGYPEHNGRILVENYTTESKVRELISMGDISILGPEIGTAHSFDARPRPKGMTTFYERDRGEKDVRPQLFSDRVAFVQDFSQEYNYLFIDGVWHVNQYGSSYYDGIVVFDTVQEVLDHKEYEQSM